MLINEVRPPFSPEAVAVEFAATFERYHISVVEGDQLQVERSVPAVASD